MRHHINWRRRRRRALFIRKLAVAVAGAGAVSGSLVEADAGAANLCYAAVGTSGFVDAAGSYFVASWTNPGIVIDAFINFVPGVYNFHRTAVSAFWQAPVQKIYAYTPQASVFTPEDLTGVAVITIAC